MRPDDSAEEREETEELEEKPEYDFDKDWQTVAGLIMLAFCIWVFIRWLNQTIPPPYPPLPALR
jgi:hypothetical protein